MGISRAGDDDGVDRRIGKNLSLRRNHCTVAARQPFRGGGIDIDDRMEPGIGMTGNILRMDCTDAASAELAKADHVRGFGYCFARTL